MTWSSQNSPTCDDHLHEDPPAELEEHGLDEYDEDDSERRADEMTSRVDAASDWARDEGV